MKERETEARKLTPSKVGEFTLLNSEKLGRVLDLLEDAVQPANADEARIVALCKKLKNADMRILALYDRFGGAVRMGDRKLVMGTFYDFGAREPREKAEINESDYEDEFVLVRKQARKGKKNESIADRLKRADKAGSDDVDEDESEEEGEENDEDTKVGSEETKTPKKKAAKKSAK